MVGNRRANTVCAPAGPSGSAHCMIAVGLFAPPVHGSLRWVCWGSGKEFLLSDGTSLECCRIEVLVNLPNSFSKNIKLMLEGVTMSTRKEP